MRPTINSKLKLKLESALLKLRVTLLMMLTFVFTSFANSFAQDEISLEMEDAKIVQILDEIEALSDYKFIYSLNIYDFERKKSISVSNEKIINVLDYIFEKTVDYDIRDNNIILKKKIKLDVVKIDDDNVDELQRVVTGNVTDIDGNPLPGASVIEVGTTNGTTSDFDGNFSINLTETDAILQVSFVGFQTTSIDVSNGNDFQVVLLVQSGSLDEIVVTGFGTQSKRDITGSISVIDSEIIENRGLTSAGAALSGTTAGVFVSQNSGEPGQDEISIQIRGVGTLNNSNPLVIVDGIEGDINLLNPNDIESISVLKDAASAAIYGSRAANGVVLVKTKRGFKNQKTTISYEATYGSSEATMLPDLNFDAAYAMEFRNLAATNFGSPALYSSEQIQLAKSPNNWWKNPYNDLFQSAPVNQHNLSVSGGSEKTNYRIGLGILDQESIATGGNYYDRVNLRFNLDTEVTDQITVGTTMSLSRGKQTGYAYNSSNLSFGPVAIGASIHNVLGPKYNDDGTYAIQTSGFVGYGVGPGTGRLSVMGYVNGDYTDRETITNNILMNSYVAYEPVENLVLKATAAVRSRSMHLSAFDKSVKNYYPDGTSFNAPANLRTASRENEELFTETYFLTADYNIDLGNENNLSALIGYSQEENYVEGFTAFRDGFLSDSVQVLDAGQPTNQQNTGTRTGFAVMSYFARINFDHLGKYLFEANVRRDGSSRFKNDKWGVFPSFSAGWIVSEENFLSNSNSIDFLKIRASVGELGNSNIDNFAFAKKLSLTEGYSFGGTLVPGVGQSTLGNENLSWEKTSITNFGFNLILANGLGIDFDVFDKRTSDILYEIPVNVLTGFTSQIQNAASVKNTGWELSLNYKKSFGDLNMGFSGNISKAESIVTDLNPNIAGDQDRIILNNGGVLGEGYRLGAFYGLKSNGLFRTDSDLQSAPDHSYFGSELGDVRFVDINGDGKVDLDDRTDIGTEIPEIIYGFNIAADYKNWDMLAMFQGIGKASFSGRYEMFKPDFAGYVPANMWADNWTPENTDAKMPRIWTGDGTSPSDQVINDFLMYDRSYLRLKNLQIGYTFNVDKLKLSKLRAFFNGSNLLTFTDFPTIDPEVRTATGAVALFGEGNEAAAGRASVVFPQIKIVSFGIQATF